MLVNCTPVGMHPNVDDSPFDKHYLRPSMVVFDAVYNPENTLLIKEARNRNCTVVTGVEMFVRQACFQFRLFTGQDGPADLMREVIRRAIGAAKIDPKSLIPMVLSLIGYRATGKTTLARLLAARLGWAWIDADVEIERRAGKSIARSSPKTASRPSATSKPRSSPTSAAKTDCVLAAGGGAPLRPESRRAMRKGGKVVWLTAPPETILRRMSGDRSTAARRPNLTDRGPREEVVELLARRTPIYREAAHLEVDTEGRTPEQLATEILARLGFDRIRASSSASNASGSPLPAGETSGAGCINDGAKPSP